MSDRMPVTTFAQLKSVLRDLMENSIPAYVLGPPGCAKTACALSLPDRDAGEEYFEFRPILHRPEDLKFPIVHAAEESINWVQSIFPKDPDWKGVVCIDEMGQADRDMQAAMFGLFHFRERKIGNYHLPKGAKLMATSNRVQDKAGVQKMLTPLAARVCQIDFEPDTSRALGQRTFHDELCEHMLASGHAAADHVVGFLRAFPQSLLTWNADRPSDSATPRGWEMLAAALKPTVRDTDRIIADGIVGPSAAVEFTTYREIAVQIDPLAILANPKAASVPENQPSLMWATVSSLVSCARKCDAKQLKAMAEYFCKCPAEYAVYGAKDATAATPNNAFLQAAGQTEFFKKYGPLLVQPGA
jgi:hypothetical protein